MLFFSSLVEFDLENLTTKLEILDMVLVGVHNANVGTQILIIKYVYKYVFIYASFA